MAIYSLSADVFSRSKGHRATAAAAYRAGVEIEDQTIGERFDYRRKRGIVHAEIMAPENAPEWMHDRAALWNAVELQETRSNSQLAREVMVALPHELSAEERLELVRGFVRSEFVDAGMVADLTIHAPSRQGDGRNHHAHIMLTMRHIEGDGFAPKKAREWNSDELLEHWREAWAERCNAALEAAGFDARVDHRSLEAQGIDREPTEHMGKDATNAERKGRKTERGDRNRDTRDRNREMDELVDELAHIDAQIAANEERRVDDRFGALEPETLARAGEKQMEAARQEHEAADRLKADRDDRLKADHPEPDDAKERQHGQPEAASSWWQRALHFAHRISDVATAVRDPNVLLDPEHPDSPSSISALQRYSAAIAEVLTRHRPMALPWTKTEIDPEPTPAQKPHEPKEHDSRTWSQRADEYAAGHAREIRKTGEIKWRDGLNWWQRTAVVLGTARDHAIDWTRNLWKNYIDLRDEHRDNPPRAPDIDK
jgi:hypothetical protein